MDVEGQEKLRRRDRVRKINQAAKGIKDGEETSASTSKFGFYYPFIVFLFILFVLLYVISSRKGGNRRPR